MLESAKLPEVRTHIANFFQGITKSIHVVQNESFYALGWFCSAMLDCIKIMNNESFD